MDRGIWCVFRAGFVRMLRRRRRRRVRKSARTFYVSGRKSSVWDMRSSSLDWLPVLRSPLVFESLLSLVMSIGDDVGQSTSQASVDGHCVDLFMQTPSVRCEGRENCIDGAISALRFISRGMKKWIQSSRSRDRGCFGTLLYSAKRVAALNVNSSINCGFL